MKTCKLKKKKNKDTKLLQRIIKEEKRRCVRNKQKRNRGTTDNEPDGGIIAIHTTPSADNHRFIKTAVVSAGVGITIGTVLEYAPLLLLL